MLQNVNKELLTDVKELHNALTTPTQNPPISHTTPTQLSLWRFQKLFVPLPTMEKVDFIAKTILLHVHIYCFTNFQSSWE